MYYVCIFYSDIEYIKISGLFKKDAVIFGDNFEVLLDCEAIRHPVLKGVVICLLSCSATLGQ
jgi:hypothetical protein